MTRVAIVYPWNNIESVPCLMVLIDQLEVAGSSVDVFTTPAAAATLAAWAGARRIRTHVPAMEKLVAPQAARRSPFEQMVRAAAGRVSTIAAAIAIRNSDRKERFTTVIGVDPQGLARAQSLFALADVPVIYYSLELNLRRELKGSLARLRKQREVAASRRARIVIVQDPARGALLATDNAISPEALRYIPNAPLGPARRAAKRLWHERFHLKENTRVVLHAGSLEGWTAIDKVIESVPSWPSSWVLVVHSREPPDGSARLHELMSRADRRRVLFSTQPASPDRYAALVDSADVGVAFYVPTPGSRYTQENLATIGLASGKISYYLRAGLPVLVNRATSAGGFVHGRGCGIAVEDESAIAGALRAFEGSYPEFSAAAIATFNEILDPARSLPPLIAEIHRLHRRTDS